VLSGDGQRKKKSEQFFFIKFWSLVRNLCSRLLRQYFHYEFIKHSPCLSECSLLDFFVCFNTCRSELKVPCVRSNTKGITLNLKRYHRISAENGKVWLSTFQASWKWGCLWARWESKCFVVWDIRPCWPPPSSLFIASPILRPWRWRQNFPSKRRLTTRCYMLEDRTVLSHRCEDLKCFTRWKLFGILICELVSVSALLIFLQNFC
jgi:hypothetical protein